MFSAFAKAFAQLPDKTFRKVILFGIAGALVLFIGLFALVSGYLFDAVIVSIPWVDTALDWLGSIAVVGVVWLFFPAIASLIIGFLLEDIVDAVEEKHYPSAGPVDRIDLMTSLVEALKLAGMMIGLNLLALPIYLFFPAVNLVVFYALNGYLISREYFELVAQRRVGVKAAKAVRKAYGGRLLIAGAMTAFLLTIPLLNLLAPVIGTAVMVHLFHRWRPEDKFRTLEQNL